MLETGTSDMSLEYSVFVFCSLNVQLLIFSLFLIKIYDFIEKLVAL